MDKYVPLSKKSKKEQKKFHAMQRKTWNGLSKQREERMRKHLKKQ